MLQVTDVKSPRPRPGVGDTVWVDTLGLVSGSGEEVRDGDKQVGRQDGLVVRTLAIKVQ